MVHRGGTASVVLLMTSAALARVPQVNDWSVFIDVLMVLETRRGDGDAVQLTEYSKQYLKAVDVRFATLSQPKFKILFAGVVFIPGSAFPAGTDDPDNTTHVSVLEFEDAVQTVKDHVQMNNPSAIDYDIAVLFTKRGMGNKGNYRLEGGAHHRGACDRERNIVAVEHYYKFDGVVTACHEIAHTLGVKHDGSGSSKKCSNGIHIMSTKRTTQEQWSSCSTESLRNNVFSSFPCIHQPGSGEALKTAPPAASIDYQCQVLDYNCSTVHCTTSDNTTKHQRFMDGLACGEDMACLRRECVPRAQVVQAYGINWQL